MFPWSSMSANKAKRAPPTGVVEVIQANIGPVAVYPDACLAMRCSSIATCSSAAVEFHTGSDPRAFSLTWGGSRSGSSSFFSSLGSSSPVSKNTVTFLKAALLSLAIEPVTGVLSGVVATAALTAQKPEGQPRAPVYLRGEAAREGKEGVPVAVGSSPIRQLGAHLERNYMPRFLKLLLREKIRRETLPGMPHPPLSSFNAIHFSIVVGPAQLDTVFRSFPWVMSTSKGLQDPSLFKGFPLFSYLSSISGAPPSPKSFTRDMAALNGIMKGSRKAEVAGVEGLVEKVFARADAMSLDLQCLSEMIRVTVPRYLWTASKEEITGLIGEFELILTGVLCDIDSLMPPGDAPEDIQQAIRTARRGLHSRVQSMSTAAASLPDTSEALNGLGVL